MSEVADQYRRLSDGFASRIEAVTPDAWEAPTPCPEWNVRELVGHVVEMNQIHLGLVGRTPRPGPGVDKDPLGAFLATRDQAQEDLEDPARAAVEFDSRFGRWTFAQAIARGMCVDLAIHGWDLSRATGQDDRIDPDVIPLLWRSIESIGEEGIRFGFGPALDPPPGTDEQTRLLAYLGRRT
jgi:uncharacterized protein (TIGR03086 family)